MHPYPIPMYPMPPQPPAAQAGSQGAGAVPLKKKRKRVSREKKKQYNETYRARRKKKEEAEDEEWMREFWRDYHLKRRQEQTGRPRETALEKLESRVVHFAAPSWKKKSFLFFQLGAATWPYTGGIVHE